MTIEGLCRASWEHKSAWRPEDPGCVWKKQLLKQKAHTHVWARDEQDAGIHTLLLLQDVQTRLSWCRSSRPFTFRLETTFMWSSFFCYPVSDDEPQFWCVFTWGNPGERTSLILGKDHLSPSNNVLQGGSITRVSVTIKERTTSHT